jgi:hypothetical protein
MVTHSNDGPVDLFKAKDMFKKPIPFKVYCLVNDEITGTAWHTHDYMQIWYVMNGCCDHQINNTFHHLTRGNLFVLPPFVKHKIIVEGSEEVKIVGCEFLACFINENISWLSSTHSLFDFAYLEPFLVSHEAVKPRLHLDGKSQLKVEELFTEMLTEFKEEKKYYEINVISRYYSTCYCTSC